MTAHDVTAPQSRPTGTVPEPRAAEAAGPGPAGAPSGRRPRDEYWDVATVRWVARSPVPAPRRH